MLRTTLRFLARALFRRRYLESIQRHRAERYDAFVSYAADEPDAGLALDLFEALDTYRLPGILAAQDRRRELADVYFATEHGEAGEQIEHMLREEIEKSDFLVVLCSPRISGRFWVEFEVRTFIETHEPDRVLPVLVEGEPADVIPSPLDPGRVAADLRAPTRSLRRKAMKREKLRLLARILDVPYAELRQRHLERLVRRFAVAAALAVGVLAVVAGLATVAYLQWKSAEHRLEQARQVFRSVDDVLTRRMGGRAVALSDEELLSMIPGDPDASLFALIFTDLAFVSLDSNGIAEAEGYFEKADAIATGAAIAESERATILAGFAYEYGRYAEASLQTHADVLMAHQELSAEEILKELGIVAALVSEKDFYAEALGAYQRAGRMIDQAIALAPEVKDYRGFKELVAERLALAHAYPLQEELAQRFDEATRLGRAGQFAEAESIFREVLERSEALPDVPAYHLQRASVLVRLAIALGGQERLDDASHILEQAATLGLAAAKADSSLEAQWQELHRSIEQLRKELLP